MGDDRAGGRSFREWVRTTLLPRDRDHGGPEAMPTFVGIDLGTTNSAVACRNAYGRPEVIANREGQNITPSVVYFGTEPPAVGQEAKEWARLGNEEIASFFKPHMGNPLFQLQFHGKTYSATELSTLVLRRLKEDAEARLGDQVDRAVITVPAYFADPQRKATIEAGRPPGFEVLRIINEPTAAALAYGLQKSGVDETVLIYDLGGGTFDVTVARITPEEIIILATAGDHDLGGKNWDDRIATFLAERFAAETGFDPLDDPVALNEVLVRSEQAKWALSERNSTRITLQLGTERRTFELSRAEFEAMTFPLMDRTRRLTEEALGEAGLSWPRLDGVLLVGGSTRMPMVRAYVTADGRQAPAAGVNVDEVVALGAAIQAAIEVGQKIGDAVPRFTLSASSQPAAAAPGRDDQPPRDRRHVAQPGHHRRQPRRLGLRQRHRDPPQPADPGREHQVVHPRDPRRGQHQARGLSDARRERRPARLHDPGQVCLRRHPSDRRRGHGRRRHVLRLQRCRAGPGRSARHRPPAADDGRAGPRRPLLAGPSARGRGGGRRARADPRLPADRRLGEHDRPAA